MCTDVLHESRRGKSKGAALKARWWIASVSLVLFGAVLAARSLGKGKHVFTLC